MMKDTIFKTLILGILIIVTIGILYFQKQESTEGFQSASDGLPRDADNPNITDNMIFGSVPQAASASIFKKAELKQQTANPDAINIDESQGGAMVNVTDLELAADPEDIQSQLEQVSEGFTSTIEGFQSLKDQAKGQAQTALQDKLQEKMQEKLKEQAKKSKVVKSIGKAKKVAVKKAKKVAQKLSSKFGNKLGGKFIKKVMEKIAAKLGKKIGEKAAVAGVKGAAMSSNPVTVAFGVILSVIAAVGVVLQVVIMTQLKGDEGVCEPGFERFGKKWPSWLDSVPGIGDIMGVLAPYLCYMNSCAGNEEEQAGLCYDRCIGGYNGVGPVCWSENVNIGVGQLKECPSGWKNDGLTCREPVTGGNCWGGGCTGGNCGWRGCEPIRCTPVQCAPLRGGVVKGRAAGSDLPCPGSHPDQVDGLCYARCPNRNGTQLTHAPGAPYQCVGPRGVSYGRGVGRPKLKLRVAKPTPPPPPPPPASSSLTYADDPNTKPSVDFANPTVLQQMSQFYYNAAVSNAVTNPDGSISFSYITKITKVIASSEQSADVLCDIINMVVNPDTGRVISNNTVTGQDRRFYFAKLAKANTMTVTAATNVNGTAPDVKIEDAGPVSVTFTANIQKCPDLPISLNKCTGNDTLEAMIKMYQQGAAPNVRVKSIDGSENTNTNVCTMAWTEATYDKATNLEGPPTKRVGVFQFQQDKSNDACSYKLQKYTAGDAKLTVKDLPKKTIYPVPIPAEMTLQGCQTTCKDSTLLSKLVDAFNTNPKNSDRILNVLKAVTPGPLRCDIEADVYVKQTKKTEKQRIRFDLRKDPSACVYTVANIGNGSSGAFIQDNTPALGVSTKVSSLIMTTPTDAVKSAQAKLDGVSKGMSGYLGKANTVIEKTFADVGQAQTLGACPKKCTDADVLESIMNSYNIANYPATRNNVTKKTMTRILKAGTASSGECDITFEEKQEIFNDLYGDAPKTSITQRTQRFKMKDTGNCSFVVDTGSAAAEGFQNASQPRGGLPGMSRPTVVNNSSPSLTPPFAGSGCDLDCAKPEMMKAVKQKYESNHIEGFSNFITNIMPNSWFSTLREAFQDGDEEYVEEISYVDENGEVVASDVTSDAAYEEQIVATEPTQPAVEEAPPAKKVIASRTLKKVNRALRVGPDKCEYEIIFDSVEADSSGNAKETKDGVGYFQATFSKDKVGCAFLPSQVVKVTSPIIPGVPSTRVNNISYSF